MPSTPADTQAPPKGGHGSHTPDETMQNNPGGLMPDIRGDAVGQGRDPEEVDPLVFDEDVLRRESSNLGVLKP